MSQKKKVIQTTATLPSNFSKQYNKSKRSHIPPILSSIISSPSFFLKIAYHIVKCCFAFYPFFSLLQRASIFYPINPPSWLKRKKFVQRKNFKRMKKITFIFERRVSQATYKNLGKGNLFTLENSLEEKTTNERSKIRESARMDKAFHSSIHLIRKVSILLLIPKGKMDIFLL